MPKIGIYRIIGTELPPRDIPGTRERVTNWILGNEEKHKDTQSHWIVNRILDHGMRRRLQRVFDIYSAKTVVIPMALKAVQEKRTRLEKVKTAIEINATRNWAIRDGFARGYDWVVVLDGDCTFTRAGFQEFCNVAATTDKSYIGIPSRRCVVYGDGTVEPVAELGEPMLAVRRGATQLFDESIPFGQGDKLKLLFSLGCSVVQGQHATALPDADIVIAGWTEHISMDPGRAVVESDGDTRNRLREKGLDTLLEDVDRPRPVNAFAAHNTAWKEIDGFFDFLGPYSGLAADVPDGLPIVEVGSWLGKSASYLARELRLRGKTNKLYCVDTWEGAEDLAETVQAMGGRDEVFGQFLRNTAEHRGTIVPLRYSSYEAAGFFMPNSVAAIFIDADHTYDAVLADLKAWYPKLRPGGLIMGHDYVPTHPNSKDHVVKAVDEFFAHDAVELRPMSRVWKHVKPAGGNRVWS